MNAHTCSCTQTQAHMNTCTLAHTERHRHTQTHMCTTHTLRGQVSGTPTALHVSHQRRRMPPSPSRIFSSALGLGTRGQCSARPGSRTHTYSGERLAHGPPHLGTFAPKRKGFHERIFGNHLVFNTIFIYKTPVANNPLYTRTQKHRRARFQGRGTLPPAGCEESGQLRAVSAAPSVATNTVPVLPSRFSGCSSLGPPVTHQTCVHKL